MKPKVHYRLNTSPIQAYILSQTHLVNAFPFCLFKIHFSIIVPSMPRSSKWSPACFPTLPGMHFSSATFPTFQFLHSTQNVEDV